MEELLYWSNQVLRYLNLKRLSIGLNEEEQRLLDGLQGAVDRASPDWVTIDSIIFWLGRASSQLFSSLRKTL